MLNKPNIASRLPTWAVQMRQGLAWSKRHSLMWSSARKQFSAALGQEQFANCDSCVVEIQWNTRTRYHYGRGSAEWVQISSILKCVDIQHQHSQLFNYLLVTKKCSFIYFWNWSNSEICWKKERDYFIQSAESNSYEDWCFLLVIKQLELQKLSEYSS